MMVIQATFFRLCIVAPLSCLTVRHISQRILEHVPPYLRTTPQCAREVFLILENFPLLQQKYMIRTSLKFD